MSKVKPRCDYTMLYQNRKSNTGKEKFEGTHYIIEGTVAPWQRTSLDEIHRCSKSGTFYIHVNNGEMEDAGAITDVQSCCKSAL